MPEPPRLVVGLGNPGDEYEGTRHNLGFEVLDRLAERLGVRFERLVRKGLFSGKIKARVAVGGVAEAGDGGSDAGRRRPFVLVKPQTYVNLSGVAVAALGRHHGVSPASIFVICDDLNLPLGRIRIRSEGGSGGHNGIKSIVSCLGTEGFPRLRIGIGSAGLASAEMVNPDYVLSGFSDEERDGLPRILDAACDAPASWIAGSSIEELMNQFNSFGAS